jgi:hypothetical protein
MLRRILPVCALLTVACGRTIAMSSKTESKLAPPDAYKCVTKQLDTLGFERTSHDDKEFRLTARKVNPKITFSSPTFQRTWDQLEAQAVAGPAGTELQMKASTAAQYFVQTGLVLNELSPSDDVKQAAQELMRRCSAPPPPAPPAPAPAPAPAPPGAQ